MDDRKCNFLIEDINSAINVDFDKTVDVIVQCLKQFEGVLKTLGVFDKTGLIESKYGHVRADYYHKKEFLRTICPPIFSLTIMADQQISEEEYKIVQTVLNRISIGDAIDDCLSLDFETAGNRLSELFNDMLRVVDSNKENIMTRTLINQLPSYIYKVCVYLISCDGEITDEELENIFRIAIWLENYGVELWPNR